MLRDFWRAVVVAGGALALLCCMQARAHAETLDIQDNYVANLSITNSSGDHVTGEAPTLMVRRNSDGYYLDWNDTTFKNSGWTTKAVTMTEDSTNGFYHYTFNPPSSETVPATYLLVYDNANTGGYGTHMTETVTAIHAPSAAEDSTAVWSETTRILTALDEDTTSLDLNGTTVGTVTTVTNVSDKTGYSLAAAGIDSIWDEAKSGHTTAGTFGYYLDAQVSSASAPTVGQVADAVWDEAIADHLTGGTTGAKLNSAAAAGDPWGTTIPGAYGAGTAGKIVGDYLDAAVSTRATPSDVTVYVGE